MIALEMIKKKSIVDVAGALGIPLKRLSSTLYEQIEHDSFKIFTNTNTSNGFRGIFRAMSSTLYS